MTTPLTPATDRDAKGRFAAGNKAGRGNPLNRHAHRLRYALLSAVKREDIREVAAALLDKAKGGDVAAIKELLDRVMGRPTQALALSGPDGEQLTLSVQTLTSVVLGALGDHPDAKVKVAAKLRELTTAGGATPSEPSA